jgi:hypothetical protein
MAQSCQPTMNQKVGATSCFVGILANDNVLPMKNLVQIS